MTLTRLNMAPCEEVKDVDLKLKVAVLAQSAEFWGFQMQMLSKL